MTNALDYLRQRQGSRSPGRVIEALNLPVDKIGIILVSNRHVDPDHILKDDDTLSLFPL